MSVPTKTGNQWLKEYREINSKSELGLFLSKRWVLLEDHQKEIERREKLREQYYKDWMSPQQQERFIGIFNDFISEYEELIVRDGKSIALEVVVSELKTLRECFGVLFDNGNEDRGMRNDEEISCDTRNTNAGLKSLTKDGLVQPMTSRPDVHEASSQDSPAVPISNKEIWEELEKSFEKLEKLNAKITIPVIICASVILDELKKSQSPKTRDHILVDKDKPSQVVVSESPSERVSKNPVGVSSPCQNCGHEKDNHIKKGFYFDECINCRCSGFVEKTK